MIDTPTHSQKSQTKRNSSKGDKVTMSRLIIIVCDLLAVVGAVSCIFALRQSEFVMNLSVSAGARFQPETFVFFLVASLFLLPLFSFNQLYRHKVLINWAEQVTRIIRAYLTFGLTLIVILFFLKDSPLIISTRGFLLGVTGFGILFVSLERMVIASLVRKKILFAHGIGPLRALVVGAGRAGEKFALRVLNDPIVGIEDLWFVDDDDKKADKRILGFPVLKGVNNIVNHAITTGADEIYVAINSIDPDRLLEIIEICKKAGLPVKVASKHFRIMAPSNGNGRDVDALEMPSQMAIRPGVMAKRVFDIVFATFFIFLTLLPGLIIALLIKLSSRGPVFYPSKRVGKGGKSFYMIKFRTMNVNDTREHQEAAKERLKQGKHMGKVEDDPRIFAVGKFLRKYSIDEIPQFINVLIGEMSVVGPRPCLAYEMDFFDDWHKRRFHVLPGITGLWQVTGRQMDGLLLNDAMTLDVYYAENYTIWMDIKILLKTVPVVLFGYGGK